MTEEILKLKEESKEKVKELYKAIYNKDINLEGRYQKIMFALMCIASFVSCLILTVFALQKDPPEYECFNRIDFFDQDHHANILYGKYKNNQSFKIIENGHCIDKYCSKRPDYGNHILWVLVADYSSITNFVTELDIFCDIETFFARMTQVVFIGRIFGMILFSYISDKYGRYVSFWIQLILIIISNFGFLFLKTKFFYLFLSFVVCSCLNIYSLSSVMSTEIMSESMYSLLNGLIAAFFTICGLSDIFVLYFLKNWNILIYVHIIVCGIGVYLCKTYLTETPLYLLDKELYHQYEEVIIKISKINQTYETSNIKSKLDEIKLKYPEVTNVVEKKEESRGLFLTIFGPYVLVFISYRNMNQLALMLVIYLAMNLVFYGQLLNIEKLEGNIYFNTSVVYIAEIIAEVSAGYLLQRLPRKGLITFCFGLSTFFCFAVSGLSEEYGALRTCAIFINSFAISVSFISVYVYSAELFSTNVKSTMLSLLSNLSNLFMLITPYLIELFASPFLLFAIFSGIATLNASILKETKKGTSATHF
jgi:MFS family permease